MFKVFIALLIALVAGKKLIQLHNSCDSRKLDAMFSRLLRMYGTVACISIEYVYNLICSYLHVYVHFYSMPITFLR